MLAAILSQMSRRSLTPSGGMISASIHLHSLAHCDGGSMTPPPLPVLPRLKSRKLKKKVFSKTTANADTQFVQGSNGQTSSHRILALKGDAILEMVIISMIIDQLPNIEVGVATRIRDTVVSNNSLAALALAYKLPDRLGGATEIGVHRLADIMEAYIAGVERQEGMAGVMNWLEPVLKPMIQTCHETLTKAG